MDKQNMIYIKVNEQNLFRNVGHTFSNSKTFISELMQNARRAKASEVRFFTSEDSNDLVVIDDGIGITDFGKLLHVADSGWDKKTISDDKPFGMGFLSCLFAADVVMVESNGKKVVIDTKKAINKEGVSVEKQSLFEKGTRITLKNVKSPEGIQALLKENLATLAAAFAIPVYWNDAEIARDFALSNLDNLLEADGMQAYFGKDFFSPETRTEKAVFAYYQGLPIYKSFKNGRSIPGASNIVLHLHGEQFKPRMPDRDKLFDEELHEEQFNAVIRQLVRAELVKLKETKSAEEMLQYWDLAKAYECGDVFNDIGILPADILFLPDATPIHEQNFHGVERNKQSFTNNVTREDVESGAIKLVRYHSFDSSIHSGAPWVLGNALGWAHVNAELPARHWATKHIHVIAENEVDEEETHTQLSVEIEPVGITATEVILNGWVHYVSKIIICDSYVVKTTDGAFSAVIENHGTSGYVNGELCLVIPSGENDAGCLIEQIADFQGEWDFYESDRDNEQELLNNIVAALRGGKAEDTLLKIVQKGNIAMLPNLHGKTFAITISEDGDIIQIANTVPD